MASPKKFKANTPSSPSVPAKAVTPTPVAPAAPAVVERSELKGSGKPKTPVSALRIITQDDIARRAHEIYASRGYAAGDPEADWYEAERQLRAGL